MKRVKLLIVEDNDDDYELTRQLLPVESYRITWTQSLAETIRILAHEKFDVILLDLGIPDSQGLETFDRIANCLDCLPVIIVFTGTDNDDVAKDALQRGAQDYLVKGSVSAELLQRSIKYSTERHKADNLLRKTNEDLLELNSELIKARDVASEASRLKSEFLANLSHEVRTPLGGIVGLAQLLLDETDPDNIKEFHESLYDSAMGLMRIVTDLLDLSKLEAGMMLVNNAPCDIRRLVKEILFPVEPSAKLKNISLQSEVADEVPKFLIVDEMRLKQILLNFLHNAVKFTEKGAITLRITYDSDAEGFLSASVTDTGIGISPQAIKMIFEPFVQADGSTARLYGGTGLGLAISKKSAEVMGGEIGVESVEGSGAMFWIKIPVRAV